MANNILISRTDSIGDVILTLPLAGVIKKYHPEAKIYFLGNDYTQSIIERCGAVDVFLNVKDITVELLKPLDLKAIVHVFPNKKVASVAKKANIPLRIGTSHRWFHWFSCNTLVHFSRKKSDLHEAFLNLKLIEPLGIPISEITALDGYFNWKKSDKQFFEELDSTKFNLIFHMKSKGSAAEWPVAQYMALANLLPENQFNILVTGTTGEGQRIKEECSDIFELNHIKDVTGKFNLEDFISFVGECDGLLACSTGPLHIAAASGIHALGLYPIKRPMHAGRWAPIGNLAEFIEGDIIQEENRGVLNITPETVKERILNWSNS
ncbi:MAG TPA: glycosyltransferase family 9 protein [Fulvivirga sp.]|nr:glycosyltransferase family 9 protein [Fulvivirga sp.]